MDEILGFSRPRVYFGGAILFRSFLVGLNEGSSSGETNIDSVASE